MCLSASVCVGGGGGGGAIKAGEAGAAIIAGRGRASAPNAPPPYADATVPVASYT